MGGDDVAVALEDAFRGLSHCVLSRIKQLLPSDIPAEKVSQLEGSLPNILRESLLQDFPLCSLLQSAHRQMRDSGYSTSHQGSLLTNPPAGTDISDSRTEGDWLLRDGHAHGDDQTGNQIVFESIQGYAASYAQESRNGHRNNASMLPEDVLDLCSLTELDKELTSMPSPPDNDAMPNTSRSSADICNGYSTSH